MDKVYERTENGVTTHIPVREAMAEVEHAMMAGRKDVKRMSSGRTQHLIDYKDGRRVSMRLVDAPVPRTDEEGRRIVTIGEKLYVADAVTPARPRTPGATSWIPEAYVRYWSGGLTGRPAGPTRTGKASMKPGTVGRAVWDAVQ